MNYIISQIVSFLGLILGTVIPQMKQKKQILFWQVMANLTGIISFALLGKIASTGLSIWGTVLLLVIYWEDEHDYPQKKRRLVCCLFAVVYMVNTVLTYQNGFDLLPLLAHLIYLYGINQSDLAKFRWCLIINATAWCIFDISALAFVMLITHVMVVVSSISAKIRMDWKKQASNMQVERGVRDEYES